MNGKPTPERPFTIDSTMDMPLHGDDADTAAYSAETERTTTKIMAASAEERPKALAKA